MKKPLTGILPVAPTPFHDDGSVDEEGMRRMTGQGPIRILALRWGK